MKFNKWSVILAAVGALLFANFSAVAQNIGVYVPAPFAAGTVVVPGASTNIFYSYVLTNGVQNGVIVTNTYGIPSVTPGANTNILSVPISDFDYAGLSVQFTGISTTTNSNVGLLVWRSWNNGYTYEVNPGFGYLNNATAPGSVTWTTNATADVHGVTTLGYAFVNTTAGQATNILVSENLKAARIQVQAAGLNNGQVPGSKPITVPNWP